ncbi:rRNA-binding ribosome biosynthesis protein NOP15 [Ascoidea rubescens DSM 1968]|uniref:RNA-binding domain-containing protein n=1 Tax=Ascoidea rubescens DSM 1968 TaxID=1344418 RepID=A0A1D2VLW0_9ASCO|nr:RNA-binding domain-containing protein [Ascoidea rubescens DSM 1968]ODV62596.1 RNA-binding domain-containing protein [Ascoidea rubescens DSM 1968]
MGKAARKVINKGSSQRKNPVKKIENQKKIEKKIGKQIEKERKSESEDEIVQNKDELKFSKSHSESESSDDSDYQIKDSEGSDDDEDNSFGGFSDSDSDSDSDLEVKDEKSKKPTKLDLEEAEGQKKHKVEKQKITSTNKSKDDKTKSKSKKGVIYIGRLPHGFYEKELLKYFSQFGDITKLRVSRNKKTGKSKHYGFIEFEDLEVAKIAAETMNNYLVFNHILKCNLINDELLKSFKIHSVDELFKGSDKKFEVVPWRSIYNNKSEKKRKLNQWNKLKREQLKRLDKKQEKLDQLGFEYNIKELLNIESV